MKSALIIFLVMSVIVLAFSSSFLQKELLSAREYAVFYEKISNELHRELMSVNRDRNEKELFLD